MARGGPLPGNIAGGLREGPALDGAILGYRRLAAPDLPAVTGLVSTVLAFRTESVPGTAPGDACINLAAHRIGASLHCHGAVLSRDPPIPAIQTLARRPAARQHARPTPRTWIGPHGGCMQSSRPGPFGLLTAPGPCEHGRAPYNPGQRGACQSPVLRTAPSSGPSWNRRLTPR